MHCNEEVYEQVENEDVEKRSWACALCPMGSARRVGSSRWPACLCMILVARSWQRGVMLPASGGMAEYRLVYGTLQIALAMMARCRS